MQTGEFEGGAGDVEAFGDVVEERFDGVVVLQYRRVVVARDADADEGLAFVGGEESLLDRALGGLDEERVVEAGVAAPDDVGVGRDEVFDEGLHLLAEGRVVDRRALRRRDQEDDIRRVIAAQGLVGVAGSEIGFRRGVEPTALTQMLAEVETV